MSTPADRTYTNDRREREALIAEIGQEQYDKDRKEAKKKRERDRQPRPNRADQRRSWTPAGPRKLTKAPQHPLSMKSIEARLAAERAQELMEQQQEAVAA